MVRWLLLFAGAAETVEKVGQFGLFVFGICGILQGTLGGVLGIGNCWFSPFGVRRWWVVWSFSFELAWLPAETRVLCRLGEGGW